MSTNTPEAQDLLRLFKCVVDTGTDVLAAFAKFKLLPSFNGNFELFLEDRKHEIFHLWQSHKSFCCACPAAGCNFKRINRIDNWIFKKIYDDNGPENRGHIVYSMGKVVQVCLHKYLTRNMAIHDLDISVIACLLRNLANLSPNETSALDIITTIRSQVCHAYSTNCYPLALLNTTWTELENALVDLADPSYKRIIQKQIKYLRKVDLEKEEITEVLKKVEEVYIILQESSGMQKANNDLIKNGFTTCENQILKAKMEINQNTDMKLAEIKEEMQQLRATINILIEKKPRRTKSPNTHNDDHKESSMYSMDETSYGEAYTQQGAKPKRKPEDKREVRATCHVEGEDLDEKSAVQILSEKNKSHATNLCFDIITAEQKCLLLVLRAPAEILKDMQAFRTALRLLINQIVHAGKIDINKPSFITLWLKFEDDLTEDHKKVITEISGHCFISRRFADSYDTNIVKKEDICQNCVKLQKEIELLDTNISHLQDMVNLRNDTPATSIKSKRQKQMVQDWLEGKSSNRKDFNESPKSKSSNSKDFNESPKSESLNSKDFNESPKSKSSNSKDFNESPKSKSSNRKDFNESPISISFYRGIFDDESVLPLKRDKHKCNRCEAKDTHKCNGCGATVKHKSCSIGVTGLDTYECLQCRGRVKHRCCECGGTDKHKCCECGATDQAESGESRISSESSGTGSMIGSTKGDFKKTMDRLWGRRINTPVGQKFLALHDYVAISDCALSFEKGEIIIVFRAEDDNWWEGEIEGHPERRGLFHKPLLCELP